MQVQVCINEEGTLRNQRFAFTDKFTLISELMQNARRAGATQIEIFYEEASKILRIVDDGCGIMNFQKLLTFNESGWDAATCAEERPFGIGFSKCLYSASRCIVASKGRRIDFLTADALNRQAIEVREAEYQPGTLVELHGVDLPGLGKRLETLCQGFALPVSFNGCEILRPYAADQLTCKQTAIGQVYLAGTLDGRHATTTLVFLQGFCVMQPLYFDPLCINVVHLDSKAFVARLPDRDKLIDENDQRTRIDACIKALWRQVLQEAKATWGATSFVETFFAAMRSWGQLDLLNDVPVLPRTLCERIVGYPIQEGYGDRDYLAEVETVVTRSDVEQGRVQLIDLESVNNENVALWMFARAKDYVVIASTILHDQHWVQTYVRMIVDSAVRVEPLGEQCRVEFEGRWIWQQVVVCDAIAITVSDVRVEITEDGLFHAGMLFIPAGECSGEPVRQVSDYMDENDQFLDSDLDADRAALADLIRRLRSVDPKATLDSLLQELKLESYPLLRGQSFLLYVGHERGEHTVRLLP